MRRDMSSNNSNESELILYTTPDGAIRLEARLQDDNLWLSQSQIGELYQKGRTTVNEHILNIFAEGELEESNVMRKVGISDFSTKPTNLYNLDMIIAVGYRVRSNRGVQFRKWATSILHEYIQKGFALNDEQLKQLGGGSYWSELQARIRDIRSSEKVFWRQVLDIFSTSIDYDQNSDEAQLFFKKLQNKMHFAVHGHTAAEVIFDRADGAKDFMGITTFKGYLPIESEVVIAKNYLTEAELSDLNHIVSGYLEFAENRARRHQTMHMKDWISHVDKILSADDRELLKNAGKITHDQAVDKAKLEYDKFRNRTSFELTPVEMHFIENLKKLQGVIDIVD
jgi:hypothetical protein